MARLQLALNVPDLDEAVDFYRTLLGAEPHKRRPGYANFAVADPPLKLVLVERPGAHARLNHLGIEVGSGGEVAAAAARLTRSGLPVDVRRQETCCHAIQDKVWVSAPDGARWEVYTVTDDDPEGTGDRTPARSPACC